MGVVMACLFLPLVAKSQDERIIGNMVEKMRGGLQKTKGPRHLFRVETPLYEFDIDGNGTMELISLEKRDGEDRIHIYNNSVTRLFSAPLISRGSDSGVYKVERKALSKEIYALLVYYYEGHTDFYHFQGTSRLYVITVDKNNPDKISMVRGPIVLEEKRERGGHYHRRHYHTIVEDFDGDGMREVHIRSRGISRILSF